MTSNIQFSQIGSGIRKPGVYAEFNTRTGLRNLPGNLQRTLIVGQKTVSGTLAAATVTDVFSDADAAALCGFGSQLHRMVLKALAANPYANLSVVAVEDAGGGTAATWTLTAAGTPTAAGLFVVALNDVSIEIGVAVTDTPTSIAAAIVAAVAARPELPFTAANVAGVATLTAKNKGTVANTFKVAVSGASAGVTLVAAVGVAGATDPDIAAALTAAFLGGHDQIVSPYRDSTNLTALRAHLASVGSYAEKRWAHGFVGSNGTLGAATTLSASLNDGWVSNPWCRNSATPPMEIAAAYAAVIAATEDPALPFDGVEVPGVAVPLIADRTSRTEEESALYNGITPLSVGPGNRVQIVRAITTYTTNSAGVADPTLLDITTTRTLKYVGRVFVQARGTQFSRVKISDRLLLSIRDSGIVLLKQLEDLEIIESVDANLPQYLVERDLQNANRINERIPTAVVKGLHVLAERFDLLL